MAVGTVGRSWVVGGWFDYFIGWVAVPMYVGCWDGWVGGLVVGFATRSVARSCPFGWCFLARAFTTHAGPMMNGWTCMDRQSVS